jgi:hypothetical protein
MLAVMQLKEKDLQLSESILSSTNYIIIMVRRIYVLNRFSLLFFSFSLARDCPTQRNGENELEKIAGSSVYKHIGCFANWARKDAYCCCCYV